VELIQEELGDTTAVNYDRGENAAVKYVNYDRGDHCSEI